jgi:hypothetical protein
MHSEFDCSAHSIGVAFENLKAGKRKLEDIFGHHLAEDSEIRPSLSKCRRS